MFRVVNGIADRIRASVPQPTEWGHRKLDQGRDDLSISAYLELTPCPRTVFMRYRVDTTTIFY
jgi:hypothetical protein